jgi:hypothetical protein
MSLFYYGEPSFGKLMEIHLRLSDYISLFFSRFHVVALSRSLKTLSGSACSDEMRKIKRNPLVRFAFRKGPRPKNLFRKATVTRRVQSSVTAAGDVRQISVSDSTVAQRTVTARLNDRNVHNLGYIQQTLKTEDFTY